MSCKGTQLNIYMYPFSPKLPSGLPHTPEQSSPCCTVGPRWLLILFIYDLCLYFYILFILFMFWGLRWVFTAGRGLSLVPASGGSSRWVHGLLLVVASLVAQQRSRHAGSRSQAQQFWRTSLVAPRHVESAQTKDQTHVPCTGRWILYH